MRAFRRVMIACAIISVLSGVIIGLAPLGLDAALSRQVSTALVLVGVCDALVLLFWDRLFRK